jgi:hypothetical protein
MEQVFAISATAAVAPSPKITPRRKIFRMGCLLTFSGDNRLQETTDRSNDLRTEGLTRIYTDETDLRTGKSKSNGEIQGSFTSFRMTNVKQTALKTLNGSF